MRWQVRKRRSVLWDGRWYQAGEVLELSEKEAARFGGTLIPVRGGIVPTLQAQAVEEARSEEELSSRARERDTVQEEETE
jgi:hypothetical protein